MEPADDVLTDPLWNRSQGMFKGRDGCRVPLPWTENGISFGFGDAPAWLPQPTGLGAVSVERQTGGPHSTLELHRRALRLSNRYARDDEHLDMLDLGDEILAFRRGSGLVCIVRKPSSGRDVGRCGKA